MDFGAASRRRLGVSIYLKIFVFACKLELFIMESAIKNCHFRLKVGSVDRLKLSLIGL